MYAGCTSLTSVPNGVRGDYEMFRDCTGITTAGNIYGYERMFYGCTSLVSVDSLAGSYSINKYAYAEMFKNCVSLTSAPSLPATTLYYRCYYGMFEGCTSLVSAPNLPAETLVEECYMYMFKDCTSLNSIRCLARTLNYVKATTFEWVDNVANNGTFRRYNSSVNWENGKDGIPNGWTIVNVN